MTTHISMNVDPNVKRKASIFVGCFAAFVVLAIVGSVSIAFFPSLINPLTKKYLDIDTDPTVKPPGDIRAYDPIANYAAIKEYAGKDVQLTEISAVYVKSDGTMDLKADLQPTPYVSYSFVRKFKPEGEVTIGADVGEDGMQFQTIDVEVGNPGKRTYVRRYGGKVNAQYSYTNHGMKKDEGDPTGSNYSAFVTDPICSFKDLWKQALDRGAPASAVARIDYEEDGYEFSISNTDFRMEFSLTCKPTSFKNQNLTSRGNPIRSISSDEAIKLVTDWLAEQGTPVNLNGLPPQKFITTWRDNADYVILQTEGSGVPGILAARCFRVEGDGFVIDAGSFQKDPNDTRRIFIIEPTDCTAR